jgi:cytochrome bd-type quinol oxidase subunit 2
MDVVLLFRIQFGMTTAFHIVFPALTIGLLFPIAVNEREQEVLIHFICPLGGVSLILPVILGYIFYRYRVIHGKIDYGEGYE